MTDLPRRSRRVGGTVILLSLLLRLYALGVVDRALAFLLEPNTFALLTYLETGRYVRFFSSPEQRPAHEAESPGPWLPPEPLAPEPLLTFSGGEAEDLHMYYGCSLRPDLARLLEQPLTWNLRQQEPTVLILHSHATESYTPGGRSYTESSPFRTLDEQNNMLSIGEHVARILAENGINAIQDRGLHDYPDYSGAYGHSRTAALEQLARHPSIRLVLDLHRDASGDNNNQLRTQATVEGQTSAQLMLVMGTNAGGLSHGNWQENLSLALKLQILLERQAPGITRPISLRSQRFNQDLSSGALLVEVGAAGNTHAEAMLAAGQLAMAIVALAGGTGG